MERNQWWSLSWGHRGAGVHKLCISRINVVHTCMRRAKVTSITLTIRINSSQKLHVINLPLLRIFKFAEENVKISVGKVKFHGRKEAAEMGAGHATNVARAEVLFDEISRMR